MDAPILHTCRAEDLLSLLTQHHRCQHDQAQILCSIMVLDIPAQWTASRHCTPDQMAANGAISQVCVPEFCTTLLICLCQVESETFLNEPMNKIDTSFSSETYHTYKDHTGRQLLHLLWGSTLRFTITAGLCAAYILSIQLWLKRPVIDQQNKRMFNAITTGISLVLGLNIASSFKDLARNMRWPILSARRRNLKEVNPEIPPRQINLLTSK